MHLRGHPLRITVYIVVVAKKAKAKAKPKKETVNPKVELVARRGSELAAKGDYFGALAHFEKVLSVDPRHLYALYGAAHCRGSLMEHLRSHDRDAAIDGILSLCHRMILRTPELSLSPTAKEDLFPRETLRFAYNALASWQMERAKSKRDLETALGHIDHCLSLTSPLDDKNAMLRYLDTKVRILLRIGRKEEAFEIVAHAPKYPDFSDIVRGTEYEAWTRRGAIKAERKSRRSLEER
jgi:tetratricopeptide (TPR) repeat protein